MDIFEKSLEIWNEIEEIEGHSFQENIIVDNEYIGKGNNCLSSVARSVIILDGKLNQLHFVKKQSDCFVHQIVLLTPQPIYKYSKVKLSTTKQFIAVIGHDTVGIVDISKLSGNKTCKKITEVFQTNDIIISVEWYPQIHDCIVILTKQSINVIQCRSDMKINQCFQYFLNDSFGCHSKSFGIKEEFVTFDFGCSDIDSDDNRIFILTDSGDVWLLPELRSLLKKADTRPKKLPFCPPSTDNYQDDFTSLVVLRGSIDVLVLVNSHGTVQHALVINEKVCVYEIINVLSVANDVSKCNTSLLVDRHAYPPRYLLLHSSGIHSCVLPWAVRLRLAMHGCSNKDLSLVFNDAGSAVIDHILDSAVTSSHSPSESCIHGLIVVRAALTSPELVVFVYGYVKRIVRARLRQESTLMAAESEDRMTGTQTMGHCWPIGHDSRDMFLKAILTELGRGGRVPYVATNVKDGSEEGEAKLSLVLKITDKINADLGSRLENAGQIMDQRLDQMKNIVGLQQDQVRQIMSSSENLQRNGRQLTDRFKNTGDRQEKLLKRLSVLSDRLAVINTMTPRVDRDSVNTIKGADKRIGSMQALLRSCKVRFEQNEDFIARMKKKKDEFSKVKKVENSEIEQGERAQTFLLKEDEDINNLVTEIKLLIH